MGQIKTSHAKGEMADNVESDFDWLHQNRQALYEQFGECIALIYNRQVLGVGKTQTEAEQNAISQLNSDDPTIMTPIIGFVYDTQLKRVSHFQVILED